MNMNLDDIFKDLDDLGDLAGFSNANKATRTLDEALAVADENCFVELTDLDVPLNCSTGASEEAAVQHAAINCWPDSGQSSDQVNDNSAVG